MIGALRWLNYLNVSRFSYLGVGHILTSVAAASIRVRIKADIFPLADLRSNAVPLSLHPHGDSSPFPTPPSFLSNISLFLFLCLFNDIFTCILYTMTFELCILYSVMAEPSRCCKQRSQVSPANMSSHSSVLF